MYRYISPLGEDYDIFIFYDLKKKSHLNFEKFRNLMGKLEKKNEYYLLYRFLISIPCHESVNRSDHGQDVPFAIKIDVIK